MTEPHDDRQQMPEVYPLSAEEPPPEIQRTLPPPLTVGIERPPVNAELEQFSLGELLGLVAVMAVLMSTISSIARWTPMGNSPARMAIACAVVFGFGALVSMIVIAWIPHARRIVLVGWWALLGLYIVTAAAAVLMSK